MTFDLVLIGLAIAIDPIPLTTLMVVLPAKRGVKKGAAFVSGWLVSLAIVVTATVLATGITRPGRTRRRPPRLWSCGSRSAWSSSPGQSGGGSGCGGQKS